MTFSNGFSIPPRAHAVAGVSLRRSPSSPAQLAQSDARALATVNGALARFGVAPLATLAQQFETDEDFLATFPELDSYGVAPRAGYWGPRVSFDIGEEVPWPAGTRQAHRRLHQAIHARTSTR